MAFSSLTAQQRVMVLLELLGGPKFSAETRAAAASMGMLGKTSETTGRQLQLAGRRAWIANQALYTLRRYAFYGTLALTAMGGAVVKLGYNYLSAMEQARVALRPVIKDHAVLEGYLNRLFTISKYSPFVITDLAVSFRQMMAGFAGTGMGPNKILATIQALTDQMSFVGKTGPGQLNRVTLALQHMAFQGRLTGRVANQLGMLGIPVSRILKQEFNVSPDQMKNIANLNIPPNSFLAAMNHYIENTTGSKGAALRLSLGSFHGLLQTIRDTVSQVSGNMLKGSYYGIEGWLKHLVTRGGALDRLGGITNRGGTNAGIVFLSRQATGFGGLGKGLILLLSIVRNIASVFVHVLVPAFVMALHTLIIFWPALKILNWGLGELSRHASIAKWIFALLATEFVITHFAMLGLWTVTKLYTIATFGAVGPIRALIKWLKVLRTVELLSGIRALKAWAFATTEVVSNLGGFRSTVFKNTGVAARFTRAIWGGVAALRAYKFAMITAGFATVATAGIATGGAAAGAYGLYESVTTKTYPGVRPTGWGANATSAGSYQYSRGGQTYEVFPGGKPGRGYKVSPDIVVHSHLHVDRQVLAESVARAQQDKAARR